MVRTRAVLDVVAGVKGLNLRDEKGRRRTRLGVGGSEKESSVLLPFDLNGKTGQRATIILRTFFLPKIHHN